MRKKSILVLAIAILSSTTHLCNATTYDIIDIGTLPNSMYSGIVYPLSINNNGQIAGVAYDASGHGQAVLFDSTGNQNNIALGTFGGASSDAISINNNGQIVGAAQTSTNYYKATVFDTSGAGNHLDLGVLEGQRESFARANNDNGQIVGYARGSAGHYRATLYDPTGNGNNTNLGILPSWTASYAESINNNGEIVGYSYNVSDMRRATLFDITGGGNIIDLGTIGGNYSYAYEINDNDLIVGWAEDASNRERATLFDITGGGNNIDLGTLGGDESWARSINSKGQIVGYSKDALGYTHATLFDPSGGFNNINLNDLIGSDLGWTLHYAYSINDHGWIVGKGVNPEGTHTAFLIVPEPATPPTADADGPYSIYVGDTLTLDASGSTDPDNDIASFIWDLKVTDSEQQSDVNDSTLTIVPKPALVVAVDIKPTSCPNPLNVKSSGVLPVAILGSEDLDVSEIVPTSIQLAGIDAIRNDYEDVATPLLDVNDCNCTKAGPDGYLDLTLKFKTQRIVEAIGEVNNGDVLTLQLTGVLFGERPIEGTDCILIRGKHKPLNQADINKDGVVNNIDFAIIAENWLQYSIAED